MDFDDDVYTEVHFLKPKFDIKKFPSGPTEARGITKNKKDNILKLLKVAPAAKKLFWQNIHVNDDLVTDLVAQH